MRRIIRFCWVILPHVKEQNGYLSLVGPLYVSYNKTRSALSGLYTSGKSKMSQKVRMKTPNVITVSFSRSYCHPIPLFMWMFGIGHTFLSSSFIAVVTFALINRGASVSGKPSAPPFAAPTEAVLNSTVKRAWSMSSRRNALRLRGYML